MHAYVNLDTTCLWESFHIYEDSMMLALTCNYFAVLKYNAIIGI